MLSEIYTQEEQAWLVENTEKVRAMRESCNTWRDKMRGVNGLGHYAAMAVQEALGIAITNQERAIENCGLLTHQDAKQSASSKAYFAGELEKYKAAIEDIRRFRAEVSNRAWEAYTEATDGEA